MDDNQGFTLSYEQLTAITEQFIKQSIADAAKTSSREAGPEMERARASLEHWHRLAQAGHAPAAKVDADHLRMTDLIWRTPSEEERA